MVSDAALVALCATADVVPGELCRIDHVPGLPSPVTLVRIGEAVFCIEDTCSHERASLADGWLDGYCVECPLHESRFDVRTGVPDALPARVPIRTYKVVVADGLVHIEVPE